MWEITEIQKAAKRFYTHSCCNVCNHYPNPISFTMLVARIQIFLTTCSRRTRFHFARVPTFYTPVRGTMSTALSGKRPDSPGHDPDTEIHDQDASIHNIKTPELPGVQHDNSFKDTSDNSVPRHKSVGIDDSKGSSITQDLSPTPRD